MIEINVIKRCGHYSEIAIMGFSGNRANIPLGYQEEVNRNVKWHEAKLCMECFMKLSREERKLEMDKNHESEP